MVAWTFDKCEDLVAKARDSGVLLIVHQIRPSFCSAPYDHGKTGRYGGVGAE